MAKLDVSMTPEETQTYLREGQASDELRGVRITGAVERLGDAAPEEVERAWSEEYVGAGELPDRRWRNRSWFPLASTASWDSRENARVRARRA